jgi:membrane fusion protein, multidrug efflux system
MTRRNISLVLTIWTSLILACIAWSQITDLVAVVAKPVSRTIDLPGEITPFLSVSLHAKVPGYVERVLVDRGSVVKEGDLLAELSAPEMQAQLAEAESRVQSVEAERLQAEAQLTASQSTYQRLAEAARTPGAVAGNDLVQAQKQVDAGLAVVNARQKAGIAAQEAVKALQAMMSYLEITAPFDGTVTERLVHPGALVGPPTNPTLLVIQQIARVRVVVPIPEEVVGGIVPGARVEFSVPAFPQKSFSGAIARIARVLDQKTRTMPVELDTWNRDGALAPGMYATVHWPVRSIGVVLFAPKSSVVTTTERKFVIRNRNGHAEWVDVKTAATEGDLVEIIGNLKPGDMLVRRATDELREGAVIRSPSK